MVPIVAYNYGAGQKGRMMKTIKLSCAVAITLMLIGLLIMQTIPQTMLRLFDASENMIEIGVPALRIISLSFVFAGFGIVVSSVFQALGNGVYSMIISIIRQLVFILPAAYLLALSGNVNLVWWAFPISEVASVICCVIFFMITYKKVIKPMEQIHLAP